MARAGELVPPPPPTPGGVKLNDGEPVRKELFDACTEGSWVTELKEVNDATIPVSVGVNLGESEGVEEAFTLPLAPTPVSLALVERDTVGVD